MTEISKEQELLMANLILPIVKDIISPKISLIVDKLNLPGKEKNSYEKKFEVYLLNKYAKFSIIDTLAFPNKQTLFDVLYEPLTLVIENNSVKKKKYKINNDFDTNLFLGICFRVIIEDTAGMGKSTISKKIFRLCIEKKSSIPILIELRHLNRKNSIFTEIRKQLSGINNLFDKNVIVNLLNEGGFTIIFDGFDEISNADREFVNKDIKDFVERAPDNYFIITSRPEDSLLSFGDFQKFNIEPLKKNEAFSLIKRYDYYSYKPIAQKLISQLKKNNEGSIDDYLENSLLVSLLFKSYDYKKDIPLKKSQFYRQIFEALFESHDLSKEGYFKREKYSKLHIDDFERVLRYIGYFTSIKNKIEYDTDYLISLIDKVKKYIPDLRFSSSDYIKDLLESVPLFKKEGNYIKWAHKSLQDYFSAKFIWLNAKQKQKEILKKIYEDEKSQRFSNILEIFYELDPQTFESTILYWLLVEFRSYAKENFNSFKGLPENLKKTRIENTFLKKYSILTIDEAEFAFMRKHGAMSIIMEKYNLNFFNAYFLYIGDKIQQSLLIDDSRKNKEFIFRIAMKKHPDLIKYLGNRHNQIDLPFLKTNTLYPIDNSKENILNSSLTAFEAVNDITRRRYIFNYDRALAMINEIEKIKSNESQEELLNW